MTEHLRCPMCGGSYEPQYGSEHAAPKGSVGYLQQAHGVCSRGCWNAYSAHQKEARA